MDIRQQVLSTRVETQEREAVTRYGDYGPVLLGHVQGHDPMAQAGRRDAADGWILVGRWLTFVAVLSVFAVAFALYGNHTAR